MDTTNNVIETHSNPATVLIAYHAHCVDGFTAAWVAASSMKMVGKRFDMLPMEYTEQDTARLLTKLSTETNYLELYVVDFSLSMDALEYLQEELPDVETVILDHHKTAFERYFPTQAAKLTAHTVCTGKILGATVYLNNNKSGASIAWAHFNPTFTPPAIVAYVEDYDLWRFKLGDDTRYVNSYLSSRPKCLAEWNKVQQKLRTYPQTILDAGKLIYDNFIDKCKEYAEDAVPVTLASKEGLAVACPGEYADQVGNILTVHSGTFGATYHPVTCNGKGMFKWSIRSQDDYDVSEIAANYGGGGHKNAAGFELTGEATLSVHLIPTEAAIELPEPTGVVQ